MTPIYKKIADELRTKIESGVYRPGDTLPGIQELRGQYGVSHITVLKAFRILREAQLVDGGHGKSYAVSSGGKIQRQPVCGRFGLFLRTPRRIDDSDNFFNSVSIGAEMEAGNRQIDLLLPASMQLISCSEATPSAIEKIHQSMIASAQLVDGFLADERIPDSVLLEIKERTGKPVVVIGRTAASPLSFVTSDYASGMRTILQMADRMNYEKFVYCGVTGVTVGETDEILRNEFRKAHPDSPVIPDCNIISQEELVEKLKRLCSGRTLIVCFDDNEALTVSDGLSGRFPNTGIASCETLPIGRNRSEIITGVGSDPYMIGSRAVETLTVLAYGNNPRSVLSVLCPQTFQPGTTMK